MLEIVAAFEKASGVKIPVQFCERRVGDIDENYTSAALAEKELNWKCQYGLEEMCKILHPSSITMKTIGRHVYECNLHLRVQCLQLSYVFIYIYIYS